MEVSFTPTWRKWISRFKDQQPLKISDICQENGFQLETNSSRSKEKKGKLLIYLYSYGCKAILLFRCSVVSCMTIRLYDCMYICVLYGWMLLMLWWYPSSYVLIWHVVMVSSYCITERLIKFGKLMWKTTKGRWVLGVLDQEQFLSANVVICLFHVLHMCIASMGCEQ